MVQCGLFIKYMVTVVKIAIVDLYLCRIYSRLSIYSKCFIIANTALYSLGSNLQAFNFSNCHNRGIMIMSQPLGYTQRLDAIIFFLFLSFKAFVYNPQIIKKDLYPSLFEYFELSFKGWNEHSLKGKKTVYYRKGNNFPHVLDLWK